MGRMKFFCLLSILLINFSMIIKSDNEYIRMEYLGDPSKPFPSLLLYISDSDIKEIEKLFYQKFEISDTQFNEIKKITERNFKLKDTILRNPYQIAFIKNEETTIFRTNCLSRIKAIFELLKTMFPENPQKDGIGSSLNTLMHIFRSKDEIARIY